MAARNTFHIITLGCKVNQYETQALREAWLEKGCVESPFAAGADEIIINSCAVTANAVRDLRAQVRHANRDNPDARITITGCAAEVDGLDLETLPGVVRVVPQTRKQSLKGNSHAAKEGTYQDLTVTDYDRARAILKIQDGCSHRCTYCIIPLTRGSSVSRGTGDIIAETGKLLEAGFSEITVTGINLNQFGRDLDETMNLWKLIRLLENEFASEYEGKARFRLSSLYPAQLTDEALEVLSESRMVCPHLHLSLQSLAPEVLKKMGRAQYRAEDIATFLEKLSSAWPVFGLGADFIAGFPGETAQDAAITLENAKLLPLTYAHVFPYSPRPGTRSADMPGQVPNAEKKARAKALRDLAADRKEAFLNRLLEQPHVDVVLEQTEPLSGTNEYYIDCRFTDKTLAASPRQLVRGRPVGVSKGILEVEACG